MKAVNVAAQAFIRSVSKVVGSEVFDDAIAFFPAFEGMEQGFKERAEPRRPPHQPATSFVLVASPKADTVEEASYFAGSWPRPTSRPALIINRMQPSFSGAAGGEESLATGAEAIRARAGSLAGTDLGDLYTCLADARELARDEEAHLAGLATRIGNAPVVRVPVLPFEVTDLPSLDALGRVLFAPPSQP